MTKIEIKQKKDIENGFEFDTQKGDMVVVDIIAESGEIRRNTWDIEKEWPIEATGASSVVVPWTF